MGGSAMMWRAWGVFALSFSAMKIMAVQMALMPFLWLGLVFPHVVRFVVPIIFFSGWFCFGLWDFLNL